MATIDLPLNSDSPAEQTERSAPARAARSETILLAEDEEVVRRIAREMLEWAGYMVLEASTGAEALTQAQRYAGRIDLLVTDVVMPGMSGRELALAFMHLRPESRLLYMSGYADGAVIDHGVFAEGTIFLQKPFTMDALTAKVRQVLDQPTGQTTAA
jgi:two-component system, cell cycle sensor histidine kinase and response regulator CckA